MAYTPKPFTLLETLDDGTEIRLYEDGSKRDQKGRLLEYLETGNEIITPETARLYHQKRKQKILESIESKLTDVTKTNLPSEAIAAIVGKRAEIAMTDDTRTGNEAAKIVLSAVDAYQDKRVPEHQSTIRNEYVMDDETRALLHALMRERRENSTDVLDVDETGRDGA